MTLAKKQQKQDLLVSLMSRVIIQSEDIPDKQKIEIAVGRLRRMHDVLASYQIEVNTDERKALAEVANFLEMISKQR